VFFFDKADATNLLLCDSQQRSTDCRNVIMPCLKPKFHLLRHVTTRHDTQSSPRIW